MTGITPRIQILSPERLAAVIHAHSQTAEARQRLGEAILRLLELHTRYLVPDPQARTADRSERVGTWLPDHRSENEIDWVIMHEPEHDGLRGRHVLNGGLIHHSDGTWGIHT